MPAAVDSGSRPPPGESRTTPRVPGRGPHEPPFVGRIRELAGLLDQLDAALAGQGGVALLVGEPGIGKTRTAQRLAAIVQARGGQVLWGRCFEADASWSWSPPFGPWVEALGRWAASIEPRRLRELLGAEAAAVAPLVPTIGAALPGLPTPTPLGADEERVRVQDAIVGLLVNLARRQPLLLVLDDLHWADPASLGLLRELGRAIATAPAAAPLLVAGTYRGEEVAPGHPLPSILADLRREADAAAYPLAGLARSETADLLARLAGERVSPALVDAIQAETDGNPFFARELFRHLAEEGRLDPRADGLALGGGDAAGGAGAVPDGVRQVVGRRLARLGDGTNRMLGQAAIANGGFGFGVLQALTGLAEGTLLDALDEALASGLLRVVDQRRERYDFVHAIVRHALTAQWSPSRRVRLHRRLAEALERSPAQPGRGGEHAAELAIQYHASAALPGAGRGVAPALAAADWARAATDREGAVRFLRMARDLDADLDPGTRAGILSKLALAEAEALLLDDAHRTVEEAVTAMAEADAPPAAVAGFLGRVAAALDDGGAPVATWRPLAERGLALIADRRDLTWARLTLTLKPLAPIAATEGSIQAPRWLGSDPAAVALARASGDEEDFACTVQAFDLRRPSESRALLERARCWQRPTAAIRVLTMIGADWLYLHGDLTEAMAVFEELLALAERHGSLVARAEALIRLALARVALGEHEAARSLEAQAEAALARLGPSHHLRPSAAWVDALLADHLSDDPSLWAGIGNYWQEYVVDPRSAENALVVDAAALAAYAQARAGHPAAARRLLGGLTGLLDRLQPTDWLVNGAVAFGSAAVWTLAAGEPDPVEGATIGLAHAYRGFARALVAAERGDYPGTSTDLALARMAALVGDRGEAGERFARARITTTVSGRRPLRAMVDHDEAVALLRWGRDGADAERLGALLDDAEEGFRALGMTPWRERTASLRREAAGRVERAQARFPAGLSEREVDVLRLVAQGCSDRVVGNRLFLSPRTVNAHVRNMLRKTDRANRTELSVWAVEHGLVP